MAVGSSCLEWHELLFDPDLLHVTSNEMKRTIFFFFGFFLVCCSLCKYSICWLYCSVKTTVICKFAEEEKQTVPIFCCLSQDSVNAAFFDLGIFIAFWVSAIMIQEEDN